MVDIFDTVADATRRSILERLRGQAEPMGASELVESLGVTRQSVNRHLGVLAEAGLVVAVDDGPERAWVLDPSPLEALEDWLVPFLVDGPDATVFSAWSGTDVAGAIGRAIAERSFQARSAIQTVQEHLPEPIRARIPGAK